MNQIKEHENLNKELTDQFLDLAKAICSLSEDEREKFWGLSKIRMMENIIEDYDEAHKNLTKGFLDEAREEIALMKTELKALQYTKNLILKQEINNEK